MGKACGVSKYRHNEGLWATIGELYKLLHFVNLMFHLMMSAYHSFNLNRPWWNQVHLFR